MAGLDTTMSTCIIQVLCNGLVPGGGKMGIGAQWVALR